MNMRNVAGIITSITGIIANATCGAKCGMRNTSITDSLFVVAKNTSDDRTMRIT